MTSDDHQQLWRSAKSAIEERVGRELDAFVLAFTTDGGKTMLWGADYGANPDTRAKLLDRCQHFAKELRRWNKRESANE